MWKINAYQAPEKVSLECEDLDSPVSCLGWSEDGAGFALGKIYTKIPTKEKLINLLAIAGNMLANNLRPVILCLNQ